VLVLGALTRTDVPTACECLRVLVEAGSLDVVACDVSGLSADVVAIEALARLQLTAQRLGCELRIRHASRELQALATFCGLGEVLPSEEPERGVGAGLPRGLGVGVRGQTEEREQARGIEERVDADDALP
jgi:ABC-type transporter Mla MlaB component